MNKAAKRAIAEARARTRGGRRGQREPRRRLALRGSYRAVEAREPRARGAATPRSRRAKAGGRDRCSPAADGRRCSSGQRAHRPAPGNRRHEGVHPRGGRSDAEGAIRAAARRDEGHRGGTGGQDQGRGPAQSNRRGQGHQSPDAEGKRVSLADKRQRNELVRRMAMDNPHRCQGRRHQASRPGGNGGTVVSPPTDLTRSTSTTRGGLC